VHDLNNLLFFFFFLYNDVFKSFETQCTILFTFHGQDSTVVVEGLENWARGNATDEGVSDLLALWGQLGTWVAHEILNLTVSIFFTKPETARLRSLVFETDDFDLPCTAGLGLLVKLRLIRIRADDGARERTRTFEIRLVPAVAGMTFPIKRADQHAIIYHIMHQQTPWDNADSASYLIT
jgi:hypothetical protein